MLVNADVISFLMDIPIDLDSSTGKKIKSDQNRYSNCKVLTIQIWSLDKLHPVTISEYLS